MIILRLDSLGRFLCLHPDGATYPEKFDADYVVPRWHGVFNTGV